IQSAIYRISEAANSAKDLPELYGQIHKVVGGLMPATNFYIALVDDRRETLEFPYFVDEEEGAPRPQKLGRGLTEYVLRTGRAVLASPEVFDRLIRDGEVVLVGPPSVDWVGAPLTSQGKTIGVIVVQSYAEGVRFSAESIRALLGVSKTRDITMEPTDLRSIVRAAVESERQKMKPGVTLEVDLGEKEARARVDPPQIQEVVGALLRYAVGSSAGGTVWVRIEVRPEGIAIVVSDPAGEWSEEVRAHLFEPYLVSKGEGPETGLGLVLSKHVVTGHGGTIDVTSEPGVGSAFTVLLPRAGAE